MQEVIAFDNILINRKDPLNQGPIYRQFSLPEVERLEDAVLRNRLTLVVFGTNTIDPCHGMELA